MTLTEMHIWFRQFVQQMGLQNTRAILPEQIDLLINTSITDITNNIIKENVSSTNDRVITDNSKIGQINSLHSLYKVVEVDASTSGGGIAGKPFTNVAGSYFKRLIGSIDNFTADTFGNKYMFIVDLSIDYTKDSFRTNYYPVRLIDDIYLADTLNDFILRPRVRTPIAVSHDNQIEIYIDEQVNENLPQNVVPNKIRVGYIAKPRKVQYLQDLNGTNVDCDLPDYMHIDVLKHAVDLYRIAISGALQASQQQEQVQQQEMARNNYRNNGN